MSLYSMLKNRELYDKAFDLGIKVINATKEADKYLVGIHLLSPDIAELEDALNTAERDLYPTIIIHSNKTFKTLG